MKIATIVLMVLALYFAFESVRLYILVLKSRELVERGVAYTNATGSHNLLVVGDSTAVGVGSDGSLSVPGRLSQHLDASVENYAVSGARTHDVVSQLNQAQKGTYDIILIQVGANDVIHFTNFSELEKSLETVLTAATSKSNRVLLLTAGKIGDAPLFPWFARPLFNARTVKVRELFQNQAQDHGVQYVDIYSRESPFEADVTRYYAPDYLHLTGEGYGFWFSIVREYVEQKWPDLVPKN